MNETEGKYLDVFANWLSSLQGDVGSMLDAAKDEFLQQDSRRFLVGGINYVFTSLDLIPDGVAEIGYLDDAFVLRLTTEAAIKAAGQDSAKKLTSIKSLAAGTDLIKDFLGDGLYDRLKVYSKGLADRAARGRTAQEIVENKDVFMDFQGDVERFIEGYTTPEFTKNEKSLIKLKSFLDAKLPK